MYMVLYCLLFKKYCHLICLNFEVTRPPNKRGLHTCVWKKYMSLLYNLFFILTTDGYDGTITRGNRDPTITFSRDSVSKQTENPNPTRHLQLRLYFHC